MSREFRQRLMLGRENLDRDAASRANNELLETLLADASTRVLALRDGRAPVADGALVFLSPAEVAGAREIVYLGRETDGSVAYVAAFVDAGFDTPLRGYSTSDTPEWLDLRVVGAQLSDRDSGLFTQALALYFWHENHIHSPKTGAPTASAQSGWVRTSVSDESQVFPRTDPAVIVLVTDDDDRLLMGNNALWEANRFSLLAGYVEPGESLEAAVIREVFEESGLRVTDPQYLGSQPWPFPGSVMMGFTAKLAPGEHPDSHAADGEEILSLRWFTRDELKASLDDIKLPGRVAIARAMIEHWLGETLEQESGWRAAR
jgi:NAD+ diphosphatase